MNITVYNKTYLYGGAFIAVLGDYLGDEKIIPSYLQGTLAAIGIAFMLLSFKKPKETEKGEL